MDVDALLLPLSADAPCGPDLVASDDEAFLDYYFEALARLPERFYNDKTGAMFDRKSVDLKGETAAIGGLLKRSRDLRLLSLEAQFQILGGQLFGFIDCVRAMAGLLERYPDDVHPHSAEDATDRRNAIELLDNRATVVLPLEQATLITDRRMDQINWSMYATASGRKPTRAGEPAVDASGIESAFKNVDNAKAVEELHARLTDCAAALRTIKLTCVTADRNPFGPNLDQVSAAVAAILGFLVEVRPDLAPEDAAAAGDAAVSADASENDSGAASPGAAAASGAIRDHAGADAALAAAEAYFARREPSSPALFLLRQARALIGRPLVEAITLLLPDVANKAKMDFGAGTGFAMNMDRMRELSALERPVGGGADEPEMLPAESRERAAALMSTVETFFRQVEPSSPIPVLLFKAKTFLNRDFSAIVADLFPPKN
jgi:type VI secretion system protein ImpA